jgi:subtilisin family serine protease
LTKSPLIKNQCLTIYSTILVLLLLGLSPGSLTVSLQDNSITNHSLDNNCKLNNTVTSVDESVTEVINFLDQPKVALTNLLNTTGIDYLQSNKYYAEGIKIGIIDNGIDTTIPAYENAEIISKSFATDDFPSSRTHGTSVSSIILGTFQESSVINGTAPSAMIYSAELGGDSGDASLYTNGTLITSAFEWLIEQDVHIILTSWSGNTNEWYDIIPVLQSKNIILVGAVGNMGSKIPEAPGNHPYAIGVGAITSDYSIPSFSSSGPTNSMDIKPDVLAPGVDIVTNSVGSGLTTVSGTSFSAPFVAGGIASVLQALHENNITYTPNKIKAALYHSAIDLGLPIHNQGAGLVNFTKMLEILIHSELPIVDDIPLLAGSFHSKLYMRHSPYLINRYSALKSGITTDLPFTLVSSIPTDNFIIDTTGNLSVFSYSITTHDYHYKIQIDIDEEIQGYYEGTILVNLSLNSSVHDLNSIEFYYHLNVSGSYSHRILTNWNYNSMIEYAEYHPVLDLVDTFKLAHSLDIYIEPSNYLSLYNLSDFDVVWLIKPFTSSIFSSTVRYMDTVDVVALFNYTSNGGRLLINVESHKSSGGNSYGLIKDSVIDEFFSLYNGTVRGSINTGPQVFYQNKENILHSEIPEIISDGTSLVPTQMSDAYHLQVYYRSQNQLPLFFSVEGAIDNHAFQGKVIFLGSSNALSSNDILQMLFEDLFDPVKAQISTFAILNSVIIIEGRLSTGNYNITLANLDTNATLMFNQSIEIDSNYFEFSFTQTQTEGNFVLEMFIADKLKSHVLFFRDFSPPEILFLNESSIIEVKHEEVANKSINLMYHIEDKFSSIVQIEFSIYLNDLKLEQDKFGITAHNMITLFLSISDLNLTSDEYNLQRLYITAEDTSGNKRTVNSTFILMILKNTTYSDREITSNETASPANGKIDDDETNIPTNLIIIGLLIILIILPVPILVKHYRRMF